MTILLLIFIASGCTLAGAAYGRYIARTNQSSRLGWIGLITILVLIAALLYAAQTRQEVLTYLFGALIILVLTGLLFAAIGEFLGKRAYRQRHASAAGDDQSRSK